MRYVLKFGEVIHVNGMAIARHNGMVRVHWVNLPVQPCLLNPGDSAFNYLDSKMITVVKWYHNHDIEIQITGCTMQDVTVCCTTKVNVESPSVECWYTNQPHDHHKYLAISTTPRKLAAILKDIALKTYWY